MNSELEAAYQQRIAELVEALKQYVNVCSSVNDPNDWTPKIKDEGHYARDALSRSDNMEALNEYRDSVIEECALVARDIYPEEYRSHAVWSAILALKGKK